MSITLTPVAPPLATPIVAEIAATIATNAAQPAKASGDSGSVEQHPLPDQIAAAKFAGTGAKRNDRGIRFNKLRPGGAD